MHRETLSRSLFLSHNIFGKSLVPLNMRGTATAVIGKISKSSSTILSSRCYHRSWTKAAAQSITLTQTKETLGKSSVSGDLSGEKDNPAGPVRTPSLQKQFNLKAKDILSAPQDDSLIVNREVVRNVVEDQTVLKDASIIEAKIFASRTVEELLVLSTQPDLTLKHACLIIFRLGQVSTKTIETYAEVTEQIQSDKRFIRIFNLVQRGNHTQFPHTFLQALNGLQKLGLENSSEVARLLERELSWSMRRCPLRFLSKSVAILSTSSAPDKNIIGVDMDEGILRSAIQVLNRRWIEAITGNDFISLFKVIHLFADDKKQKIEERAADLAHQFTPGEIVRMFIVLGSLKRRPTPLLRAMAYHYSKSDHKISAKDTIDLIYALNELTFADPILMNRLCMDICDEITNIKHVPLISSLMISLGQMRYRQKDILFAVDEWMMKHVNELRVFDFAAWLQSAAILGHQSENLAAFCAMAQKTLTQSSASSPTEWVNIVHSFVILNCFNSEMLSSVLNPTFVESIENLGVKAARQKAKLLNLNYIAKQRVGSDYKGPFLSESLVKEWTVTSVNSSDEKLSRLVSESLGNFLPLAKYVELNCQLECGVFIDAKCFVDNKLKVVSLEAAAAKPNSTRNVAIIVEGYPALCLGHKLRTGQSSLNIKLLEEQQYLVISVPYTEFGYSDKPIRRVQYLEQKIKGLAQPTDAPLAENRNL